jgi:hypothetical protein
VGVKTMEVNLEADLAEVNSDAAQGILDRIRNPRHMPELTTCDRTRQGVTKIWKCTVAARLVLRQGAAALRMQGTHGSFIARTVKG